MFSRKRPWNYVLQKERIPIIKPTNPTKRHLQVDGNWGSQEKSTPKPINTQKSSLKTRSMSGYMTFMNGPISWRWSSTQIDHHQEPKYMRLVNVYTTLSPLEIFPHTSNYIPKSNYQNKYRIITRVAYIGTNLQQNQYLTYPNSWERKQRSSLISTWNIQHVDGKINIANLPTK